MSGVHARVQMALSLAHYFTQVEGNSCGVPVLFDAQGRRAIVPLSDQRQFQVTAMPTTWPLKLVDEVGMHFRSLSRSVRLHRRNDSLFC